MQPTTSTNSPQNRNEALHALLLEATGIEPAWTCDVRANPFGWLALTSPEQLPDVARALSGKARLCTVTAYSEERDAEVERRRIAYHFGMGDTVVTVTVPLYHPETKDPLPVPSITPWFLNADWNEREFAEMFDISIVGHPNMRRLFLDERLDAGIMSKLIPFSAMAHGAASNTLWEQVLEAKGVPPEERLPSLAVPAEPIKVEPKFTPVSATEPEPRKLPGKIVTLADAAAAAAAAEAAAAAAVAAAAAATAAAEAAAAADAAAAAAAAEAAAAAAAAAAADAEAAALADADAAPAAAVAEAEAEAAPAAAVADADTAPAAAVANADAAPAAAVADADTAPAAAVANADAAPAAAVAEADAAPAAAVADADAAPADSVVEADAAPAAVEKTVAAEEIAAVSQTTNAPQAAKTIPPAAEAKSPPATKAKAMPKAAVSAPAVKHTAASPRPAGKASRKAADKGKKK